ncbi:MAG: phage holin family protein [Clostridia bacterium]|nr:phage holin family protein [Clostridia bacterium]
MASICTFLFGKPDIWLMTLLAFVVIDYVSGVIGAYINLQLSSHIGFIGILKKVMYFFVVAVAHCVDVATGANGVLQNIVVGVLIANEGISILENCAKCGIPIPDKLLKALEQIKGDDNSTDLKNRLM